MNAAKTAYQAEALKTVPKFNSTESVCMSLEWLKKEGYTENKNDYKGSVLVTYDGNSQYFYKYWLSNGVYYYLAADSKTGYETAKDYNKATDVEKTALTTCGQQSGDTWSVLS